MNNIENLKTIPVIGTMAVNNCFWVSRLLFSIDYPVDTFFIINNNGKGEIDEELNALTKIKHKFVKNIKVVHMPSNLGVSTSWNLIIKSFIMSPFWIIVNDDVAFDIGFLNEMMMAERDNPEAGIIHGYPGDYDCGSWDLFLIRDDTVRKVGLFDENLYPAYCEDLDYLMRIKYLNIPRVLSLNSSYYHGFGKKNEYNQHGSQTKKINEFFLEKLNISNSLNHEYGVQKWGEEWWNITPNSLPFKQNAVPISYTKYDIDFIRKKHMGF